jgi:nicotinamidase-related amidase
MIQLDPRTTALVLIDLQKGIAARQGAPLSSADVVARASALAKNFRAAAAPVVLVNVAFAKDFGDAVKQPVDKAIQHPVGGYPDDFSDLVDGLAAPTDIRVTKHQWGAFYGTDLDVQLRRRGIQTIVLGGVATNIGVESTARQAWERNYALVIAEDATTSLSAEMHAFSMTSILPMISRIVKTADINVGGA